LSAADVRRINGFLTVERILVGISNIRNPILVSYVAKGLLPYRGLGSGIKRALEDWPDIAFTDDRNGCQSLRTKCSGCLPGHTLDSPPHLKSAIARVFSVHFSCILCLSWLKQIFSLGHLIKVEFVKM